MTPDTPRGSWDTVAYSHQPVDRPPLRLLFVDDELEAFEVVRARLAEAGFVVVTASNGVEALRLFDALVVDVVVTDIFMPESDGIELIQELRRRRPTLPIVAISGGGVRRDLAAMPVALALGATEALFKPFTADALVAAVRRVTGGAA